MSLLLHAALFYINTCRTSPSRYSNLAGAREIDVAVPFCLWVAARYLDDYQTAVVQTIRAGGDIDTKAAIVGGIVALAVQVDGIPPDWLADREELVV